MDRRNVIATLGSLGFAYVLNPLTVPIERPLRAASAIDPFQRKGASRIRLSLSAYSMRKYLTAPVASPLHMDLFDFVDYCHANGIDGAELTSYYFPEDVDESYLLKLKRHCHLQGVTISGGAIRNDFCSLDEAKVEADLEHTQRWVERYALLGAPAIRIFAGAPNSKEPISETLVRCAKNCQIACDRAAQHGVMLALENHGGVTAKADGLLEIIRQVESPAFGVNFDSGNFRSSVDPYAELEMIAPYAVNAQIKVEITVDGKAQETDLNRVFDILRAAKYSGWVALEYEAKQEPKEAIPGWLDKLKSLVEG